MWHFQKVEKSKKVFWSTENGKHKKNKEKSIFSLFYCFPFSVTAPGGSDDDRDEVDGHKDEKDSNDSLFLAMNLRENHPVQIPVS